MNDFLFFQIHGGADHGGGGAADGVADLLTFLESLTAQGGGDFFSKVLPGIAGLDNIHPLLVHFPIAFLTGFFVVDLAATLAKQTRWRYLASCLLYFGTITALFTVIAGFIAAESVSHSDNVHGIMERHEHIGIAILSLSVGLSAWRIKRQGFVDVGMSPFYVVLSALLCLLIALGADLGGLMVYHYGVAVQAVPTPEGGYMHHHDD
jgi:uncharacterized membrane protein